MLHEKKMQALESAWEAAKENKNYSEHIKNLHLYQLQIIEQDRSLGINNVRIIASGPGGNSCEACNKLSNKIVNLDKELKNQSLPVSNCTCTAYEENQTNFCLCYYEHVFDDEL